MLRSSIRKEWVVGLEKLILILVSLAVVFLMTEVVSGLIGVTAYQVMGVPGANFQLVFRGGTDYTSFISVPLGVNDDHLMAVIISRGFGTFGVMMALWFWSRRSLKSWPNVEFALLLFAPIQFLWGLAVISENWPVLEVAFLFLSVLVAPITVCHFYHKKLDKWLGEPF